MKICLIASAALLAAFGGSAIAADLPVKAPPPPVPVCIWCGFYAGLNAGYDWSNSNAYSSSISNPPFFVDFAIGSNATIAANRSNFLGGGQVGYNWQLNRSVVAGIEADIQGVANHSSVSGLKSIPDPAFPGSPLITQFSGSKSLDYLGTVRGRLGWLFTPNFLAYGTGGLAYGDAGLTVNWVQCRPGEGIGCPNVASASLRNIEVGWTAGVGAEWMFLSKWSAKLEYLWYDLGTLTTPASILVDHVQGNQLAFNRASTRFDGQIVRVGVNYNFNTGGAPLVAKY